MDNGNESDNYSEQSENCLLQDFTEKKQKRKLKSNDGDVPASKKKKINKKNELYKQPTVEELQQLRENENLFHSNLFRIQIQELLEEVKIKSKYIKLIDEWFKQFKDNLNSMEEVNEFELNDGNIFKELGIHVPFESFPEKLSGTMKLLRPYNINIIGSYVTKTMLGPETVVDILVEMPPLMVKKIELKNYVYLKKRALYLAYIAKNLKEDLFDTKSFYGNQMKPMLKIVPSGKLGTKVTFLVHCIVHPTKDKYNKCLPDNCNVKHELFFKKDIQNKDANEIADNSVATPHYNVIISHDITMLSANELIEKRVKEFPNIRDAIILLKIWLKKRELGSTFDNFNSHVITLYVIYLLQTRKISTYMSSYQIVRNVWLSLVQNDWTKDGISLCQEDMKLRIENYKKYFKCVFLDATGFHNIAAHVTEDDFKYVQHIANDSLECLKDSNFSSFSTLFLSKVPLYRSFESVLCIHNPHAYYVIRKKSSKNEILNYGIDNYNLTKNFLVNIIKEGFNKRLDNVMVFPRQNQGWEITEKVPDLSRIYVGLNFNREFCYNVIEKGPDAKLNEAKQFRDFWGTKSELYRFKDGVTRETVVWGKGKTVCNKRYISKKILIYLMNEKLGIPSKNYFIMSNEVEELLKLPKILVSKIVYGTGEEAVLNVLKCFNELNQNLRDLKNVPLMISGAQGTSSIFRYTAVFPPTGTAIGCMKSVKKMVGSYAHLKENLTIIPDYVPPIELVIQLSTSGKWPDELEALRKMKTAFYLQIAACLRTECKLKAYANTNYIDVFKDGYVFRLYIALQKEIILLKEIVEDGLTKYVDNDESIELEKKLIHMPKLTGALHGLYSAEPAFGPACCLAKRWLSAHFIDNWHFPELVVELIMASIFLKPIPYKIPNLPQVAFIRFLNLCSDNNWQLEPIIINFNNTLSREEIIEIENSVSESREKYPPLAIFTPYDNKSCIWTNDSPTFLILTRVSHLAKAALNVLEVQFYSENLVDYNVIFQPTLSEYDCLIRLRNKMNPIKWQAVNYKGNKPLLPHKKIRNVKIPVIDFNPVELYIKELREMYGEFALFFHDSYGGSTIAVLLKPTALETREFKVTTVPGRKLTENDTLTLNVSALIEGFYTVGQGLVENIEFQSKKVSVE